MPDLSPTPSVCIPPDPREIGHGEGSHGKTPVENGPQARFIKTCWHTFSKCKIKWKIFFTSVPLKMQIWSGFVKYVAPIISQYFPASWEPCCSKTPFRFWRDNVPKRKAPLSCLVTKNWMEVKTCAIVLAKRSIRGFRGLSARKIPLLCQHVLFLSAYEAFCVPLRRLPHQWL